MNNTPLLESIIPTLTMPVTWIGFVLLQGTLILAFTLLIRIAARNYSAATRHLILLAGLTAVAATFLTQISTGPFTNIATSKQSTTRVNASEQNSGSEIRNRTLNESNTPAPFLRSPDSQPQKTNPSARNDPAIQSSISTGGAVAGIDALSTNPSRPAMSPHAFIPFQHQITEFAPWIGLAWTTVSALLLLRLAFGLIVLTRIQSAANRICFNQIPKQLQSLLSTHVRLFQSNRNDILPMAFGIIKPTIIVPADFFERSATDQQTILRHEIAHLDRRDPLSNLATQLFLALAWFNPIVYFAVRLIQQESEFAADDRVIQSGLPATEYASSLLGIVADQTGHWPSTPNVAIGMANANDFARRLKNIVSPKTVRNLVSVRASVGITALFSFAIFAMLGLPIHSVQSMSAASAIATVTPSATQNNDLLSTTLPAPTNTPIQDADSADENLILLRGQVVDADGKPVPGSKVQLIRINKPDSIVTTDPDGLFQIRIDDSSGWGNLIATSPYGQTMAALTLPYGKIKSASQSKITLKLEPTITTVVTVQHNGHPLPNATVIGLKGGMPTVKTMSDQQGRVTVQVPVSIPLTAIWVIDTKNGIAFWNAPESATSTADLLAAQPDSITLDLLPKKTYTVSVMDEDAQPVEGVEIYPRFRQTERTSRKSLPQLRETYSKTDKSGVATFDWMPADTDLWFEPILQYPSDYNQDFLFGIGQDRRSTTQEMRVRPKAKTFTIRGRLVGPFGADLSGVKIIGRNINGSELRPSVFSTQTNHAGEFTAQVEAAANGSVVAIGTEWASEVWTGRLTDSKGKQSSDIDIHIYPATKVNINVVGTEKALDPDVRVIVTKPRNPGWKTDKFGRLKSAGQLSTVFNLDENVATIGLGKGKWTIQVRNGSWRSQQQTIDIKNNDPLELQFLKKPAGSRTIQGTVSISDNANSPNPDFFDNCIVQLFDPQTRQEVYRVKTDKNGDWSISAKAGIAYLAVAFSSDRNFGGIERINKTRDFTVDLRLSPTAQISGVLVDTDGNRLGDRDLIQCFKPQSNEGIHYALTRTNENGEFDMKGILPGIEQQLGFKTGPGATSWVGKKTTYQPGEKRSGIKAVW